MKMRGFVYDVFESVLNQAQPKSGTHYKSQVLRDKLSLVLKSIRVYFFEFGLSRTRVLASSLTCITTFQSPVIVSGGGSLLSTYIL